MNMCIMNSNVNISIRMHWEKCCDGAGGVTSNFHCNRGTVKIITERYHIHTSIQTCILLMPRLKAQCKQMACAQA